MTTTNERTIRTASWKPETREDIAGKETLYVTARITSTGECVKLTGHYDGSFQVNGDQWYNWRELDSFCL